MDIDDSSSISSLDLGPELFEDSNHSESSEVIESNEAKVLPSSHKEQHNPSVCGISFGQALQNSPVDSGALLGAGSSSSPPRFPCESSSIASGSDGARKRKLSLDEPGSLKEIYSETIKEEIRCKIQLKRISMGKEELKVDFTLPEPTICYDAVKIRNEIREKNKMYAKQSRERARAYRMMLFERNKELTDQRNELQRERDKHAGTEAASCRNVFQSSPTWSFPWSWIATLKTMVAYRSLVVVYGSNRNGFQRCCLLFVVFLYCLLFMY